MSCSTVCETDADFDLLHAWRGGDRAAGSLLLARHFDAVYRFFVNKIGPADVGRAEDLVQRTFLACVESRDRFEGRSSLRTYVFTVARHELYRSFRRGALSGRDATPLPSGSLPDPGSTPSRIAARRQEHRLLLAALRTLPLELQIAVELHYWEGLSTAELGEVMGVPQGTAKSRLRRARELLDEKIRRLAQSPTLALTTAAHFDHWAKDVADALDAGAR